MWETSSNVHPTNQITFPITTRDPLDPLEIIADTISRVKTYTSQENLLLKSSEANRILTKEDKSQLEEFSLVGVSVKCPSTDENIKVVYP